MVVDLATRMKLVKISPAFTDERGSIADIFYKANIDHVAVIKSNDGPIIRGNHYHKLTEQHIYMSKGCLRYWYSSSDSKHESPKSVLVEEGWMVSTPPLEVHALEMLGLSEFIVFSSGLRGGNDYEADTYRDITILTPDMLKG